MTAQGRGWPRVRLLAAAGAVIVVAALLSGPLPSAVASDGTQPDTPASAQLVTTLPGTASSSGGLRDLSSPALDPVHRAVAAACLPGQDIAVPRWALLAPHAPTTVMARAQARSQIDRFFNDLLLGVAFVSAQDLSVLQCATGRGLVQLPPRVVDARGIYVVSFLPASTVPWNPQIIDYGWGQVTYVDRTTGVVPSHDVLSSAAEVDELPFSDAADRYYATTEPMDDVRSPGPGRCLYESHELRGRKNSVWYRFRPSESGGVRVLGATMVGVLDDAGRFLRMCPPDATLDVVPGRTYVAQVADEWYFGSPSGPIDQGRPRRITIERLAPPGEPDIQVQSTGVVDPRWGRATVNGTVACSGHSTRGVELDGEVTQSVAGRARGSSFSVRLPQTCDGLRRSWSAALDPPDGQRFVSGTLSVRVDASVTNASGSGRSHVEVNVQLKPVKRVSTPAFVDPTPSPAPARGPAGG